MTIDAVKDRSKTVTRRHVDTWKNLYPGDRLTLIEKGMGLPKGAKQVVLAEVEVVRVTVERLNLVTQADCAREGLPDMSPLSFMRYWAVAHGYPRWLPEDERIFCRRIEWRYL
jgi:hypothetical protein